MSVSKVNALKRGRAGAYSHVLPGTNRKFFWQLSSSDRNFKRTGVIPVMGSWMLTDYASACSSFLVGVWWDGKRMKSFVPRVYGLHSQGWRPCREEGSEDMTTGWSRESLCHKQRTTRFLCAFKGFDDSEVEANKSLSGQELSTLLLILPPQHIVIEPNPEHMGKLKGSNGLALQYLKAHSKSSSRMPPSKVIQGWRRSSLG